MQFLVQFFLVPLQSLPGLGGPKLADLPVAFREGAYCFAGVQQVKGVGDCGHYHAALSLLSYFVVFLAFNIVAVELIKQGGAVLMAMATAMAMPMQNLAFSLPLPSRYGFSEPISPTDVVGLLVVLCL